MKKLLSVSILAATLASTASFAAPAAAVAAKANGNNTPDVLLVASNAASNVQIAAAIIQNALKDSRNNTLLESDLTFNVDKTLKSGKLSFAESINGTDVEAAQAAIVSGLREAKGSNGAGWEFAKFVAGQSSNDVGTLIFIDGRQGVDTVQAIEIKVTGGKSLLLSPTKVPAPVAKQLIDNKKGASLSPADVAKAKG